MDHVKPYLDKLEAYLHTSEDPVAQLFIKAEAKTGVKRAHLAFGAPHAFVGRRWGGDFFFFFFC